MTEVDAAMEKLVDAVVKEVLLAQGTNPGSDEVDRWLVDNPVTRTQIAARIFGWVNARLGLVHPSLWAASAVASNQMAQRHERMMTPARIATPHYLKEGWEEIVASGAIELARDDDLQKGC